MTEQGGIKDRLINLSTPEPNTGCWLWLGDHVKGGYGRVGVNGKKELAHRASYEAFVGKIPDGLTIDHLCVQPACINPLHLEPVTMKENTMRGSSFSKINALKTHCPKNHPLSGSNLFVYKDGRRGCRACIKRKGKERYQLIKKIMTMTEPFLMPNQHEPFNGDTFLEEKFIALRDKYNVKTILELGTCVGGTTKWLAANFTKVITTEINEDFYNFCKIRVGKRDNVHSILGDTVDYLPALLEGFTEAIMIFADDHWGDKNPLLDELRIIAEHHIKPILIVHDFKVPGHPELGYDSYNGQDYEWSWIAQSIVNIYGMGGYTVSYNSEATGAKRGVIFIEPK